MSTRPFTAFPSLPRSSLFNHRGITSVLTPNPRRSRERSFSDWKLLLVPVPRLPSPLPQVAPFPLPRRASTWVSPPFPLSSPTPFFPSLLPSLPSAPSLLSSLPRPHFLAVFSTSHTVFFMSPISFIFSPFSSCQSPHCLVWLRCCLLPR